MQSIKEIKTRIKSVTDTAKITKAMELISASKMSSYSAKYSNNMLYYSHVQEVISNIIWSASTDIQHKFLEKRTEGKNAFIIIGSDKGLAGDYNYSLLKYANNVISENPDSKVFCVGKKVSDFFANLGDNVEIIDCNREPILEDARKISTKLEYLYSNKEINSLSIIFTKMVSKAYQEPSILKVLPMEKENFRHHLKIKDGMISTIDFEPSYKRVFDKLVPEYLVGMVYTCLIQSKYSEHLERMRAMNGATSNALDLVDELNLTYNKVRQEKITTELNELGTVHLIEEN